MPDENRPYWFSAKTFGFGWVLPAAWQGWAVLLAYVVLFVAGRFMFSTAEYRWPYTITITVLLVAVIVSGSVKSDLNECSARWTGPVAGT
ncbi:MAG: hypothetical protein E2O51_01380 [Gammaproteobacteria bacterium]|nr:MAG: hypothetical protein E2O51_01380 [Gammaproteobacteria bacterium]